MMKWQLSTMASRLKISSIVLPHAYTLNAKLYYMILYLNTTDGKGPTGGWYYDIYYGESPEVRHFDISQLVQLFRIWKTTTFGETDLVAHQNTKLFNGTIDLILCKWYWWQQRPEGMTGAKLYFSFVVYLSLTNYLATISRNCFLKWVWKLTQKHTLSKPNGTLNHSQIPTHKSGI